MRARTMTQDKKGWKDKEKDKNLGITQKFELAKCADMVGGERKTHLGFWQGTSEYHINKLIKIK